MEADESDTVSNILSFCKSSRLAPPTTFSALEGLELMQAFMKIQAVDGRRKVIELAKHLSTNVDAAHPASGLGNAERAPVSGAVGLNAGGNT